MNMTRLALITTLLAAATGGALAQGTIDRADELRQSSEMMKPPTMATGKWQRQAQAPAPLSEADRKAEEFRMNTEMMRPQSPSTANRATAVSPMSEADRKVAEAMQRSEQMKPN